MYGRIAEVRFPYFSRSMLTDSQPPTRFVRSTLFSSISCFQPQHPYFIIRFAILSFTPAFSSLSHPQLQDIRTINSKLQEKNNKQTKSGSVGRLTTHVMNYNISDHAFSWTHITATTESNTNSETFQPTQNTTVLTRQ